MKVKSEPTKAVKIDGVEYIPKSSVKSVAKLPPGDKSNPFMVIGQDYFIRTVTLYFTGRLIWVGNQELVFEDCAWIPDTGRFGEFVAGGQASEVEPFQPGVPVIVGRGALIDMTPRVGGLLLKVK